MQLEQEALAFVDFLKKEYFCCRTADGLLSCLSPDVTCLGTGRDEIISNASEVYTALAAEMYAYDSAFTILDEHFSAQGISDTACLVYGAMAVVSEAQEPGRLDLHITIVCERTPEGMRLLHCNLSRPDEEQSPGQFYVEQIERADNKTLRKALHTRQQQLEALTQNIPGGVHQCMNDPNFTMLDMSDSFLSLFGYTREEIRTLFQNKFVDMIYPGDRASMLREVRAQLQNGPDIEIEYRVMCKNGTPIWVLDKGRLLQTDDGKTTFYCILIEIMDRKRQQEELRLSLERHQVILDQATDIIFEWNIGKDTLMFSPNWRKKFGYDPIQSEISQSIPLSHNIHREDVSQFETIMHDMAAGVPYSEAEFRIRDIQGTYTWSRIRATAQYDSYGRPIKVVGVIIDISAEKKEKQVLMEMAQRDALTGLYNKGTIKILAEQCLAHKSTSVPHCLLILDIDNFKRVNDTYGHLCGDALLSDVAEVLKAQFRASDLIGRIGGDEFLVFLPEISGEEAARRKAEELLEHLTAVRPAPDAQPVSCSVGVVLSPPTRSDYITMYRCADQALYHQKNSGKNGVAVFSQQVVCGERGCDASHSAVGAAIVSDEMNAADEKLAQYTFRMLYQAQDIPAAVNHLLEIIGRAYDVSRVYIFENSADDAYCSNTFEWCASGVVPQQSKLQRVSYKELGDYSAQFNEDGVFYCSNIQTLPEPVRTILLEQSVCSILQCAVLDMGKFRGYVGFDECRANRHWSKEQIATLTLISSVLSVFLTRLRLEEKLTPPSCK